MQSFIEELRKKIEHLCGDDLYLASFSFLKLNEKLGYEKNVTAFTEQNQNDVISMIEGALSQDFDWRLEKEFKAWAACLIREMGKAFLSSWSKKMLGDFLKNINTDKKISVKLIEKSCFDAGLDPNKVYLKMHALAASSENIIIKCNLITDEIVNWQLFCKNKKLKNTAFGKKRIAKERSKLMVYQYRREILSNMLLVNKFIYYSNPKLKIFWRNVYIELAAFSHAFDQLLVNDLDFVGNYAFTDWLNNIFPPHLVGSKKLNKVKNPIVHSRWFNKMVIGIKQAVCCLTDYLIKNQPSFSERDKIIDEYIKKYSRIL